ncbi:MAG TPA: HNH endonuclease signature motif containing protein [Polyangiaceae bacterium]|nr:HNH endonuclease signature motif containing protein [Polyangiaceae bacterium]
MAYILFRGPVPDGVEVCHTCDVRLCVNPEHLFLGTKTDNMRDAARKGRLATQKRPECASTRKLTAEQVMLARTELRNVAAWRLAEQWGVHEETLRNAKNGRTWKHLPMPARAP